MLNVPYEMLMLDQEKSRPCFFDSKNLRYHQEEVQCFCVEVGQRHAVKINGEAVKLLKCSHCGKQSHEACAGFNAKMHKFMCASCQLLLMDPYYKPVMTLIDPFIVHRYSDASESRENEGNPKFVPEARKQIDVEHISAFLKSLLHERNYLASSSKQLNCVV